MVDFIDLLGYPINITQPGPYTLWLQLWWNSLDAFTQHNLSGVFSVPVDSIGVALAMCNVSYFNVTLEYRNGSYIKVNEVPSARFLSDGISGALRANIFNNVLLENLIPTFNSLNATDEERMALLTQEMTRFATVSAGIFANVTGPPLWQHKVENRILGRYPIAPVLSLITLLFITATFAVTICILAVASPSTKGNVYGMKHALSELDLARLRLVSPFALIAEICDALDQDGKRSSNQSNSIDMLHNKLDVRQICVGVHEDEAGEAVFRMWIEKNEVLTKN